MQLAPICLFVYNRLDETKITVEALKANFLAAESKLFIFSDGFKNAETQSKVEEVRAYIKTITGFKEITLIESAVNKGLASSIIEGVTKIVNTHGTVIVLEDDLVTTPNFLDFMNQSLQFYESNTSIQSISGFSMKIKNKLKDSDVFFHQRTHSWGWATWGNRWDKNIFYPIYITDTIASKPNILKNFNKQCGNDISEMLLNSLSGKNNSWYVRWVFDHFITKRLTVYPFLSKVYNIGFSDNGTHCKGIDVFKTEIDQLHLKKFLFLEQFENQLINNDFLEYFRKSYKLKFRLKLLLTQSGRIEVYRDVKNKILKK
ncbi:glycosyltransferase [Flavobacterium lacustre]|uniref:glycosyltransferase n=1 Tax=Flavobacterium lacustre TaxID=3016339 RepID=UPI0022B66E66|nr:glycosyltransferase [Flavobacterium lacustre]